MALRRNLPGFYPQQAAVPRSPFTPGIAPPAADPQQSFWQQMFSPGPQTVTPGQPGAHQGGLLPFSPQQQGLLGMAGALMEAGGPSFTPTSLGQGFGRGLTAMQGAQGRAEQVAMQRQGMNMQLAQATREQEREKAADERWSAMRESMPPQEAALLDSLPAESRNRVLAKRAEAQFAAPGERKIIEGGDGYKYYADTQERVLPGVEQTVPVKAPAKPFPAIEVASGNEVLITPEQFAAAPAAYGPPEGSPLVSINQLPKPPPGRRYNKAGDLERIPGANFPEAQVKAASFGNRMVKSQAIMAGLLSAGYEPGTGVEKVVSSLPGGAYITSEAAKQYQQAKQDFSTAVLRKESGAVIGQDEINELDLKYFPQPGDGPKIKEQKRRARETAIEGIIKESQGAYEEQYAGGAQAKGDFGDQEDVARQVKQALSANKSPIHIMQRLAKEGYDSETIDRMMNQ